MTENEKGELVSKMLDEVGYVLEQFVGSEGGIPTDEELKEVITEFTIEFRKIYVN